MAGCVLVVLLLGLSGCWSQREVNNLGLVTALGIDLTPRGQIEVTMAVTHPFTAGGGQQSGGGAAGAQGRLILVRQGPTLPEAVRLAELAVPRELNLTHIQLVVLGERIARRGLDGVLDYLLRLPQMRLTTHLVLVRGAPVQRLLGLPPLMDTMQGHAMREAERKRIGLEMRLVDFFTAALSSYQAPLAPVIRLRPHTAREPQAPQQEPELAGAAIFKRGRLATYLDQPLARGAMWLRGEVRDAIITSRCPGRPDKSFSARVRRPRSQTSLQDGGQQVGFRVRLLGDLHIVDLQCPGDPSDPATLQRLETALQQDIRDRIVATIRRTQAIPADPFYFGEMVRARRPQVWSQIGGGSRWPAAWARTPVDVVVEAGITHTEVMNRPLWFTGG